MKLTQNFSLSEFLCPGVTEQALHRMGEARFEIMMLANRLQVLRDYYGRRIKINSGFRTWEHHAAIYKKLNQEPPEQSYHLIGAAADIVVIGIPAHHVWFEWKDKWSGGLGAYKTFCHFDTGPKRRWDFRGE